MYVISLTQKYIYYINGYFFPVVTAIIRPYVKWTVMAETINII